MRRQFIPSSIVTALALSLAGHATATVITDLGTFTTANQDTGTIQALANTAAPNGPAVDDDLDLVLFRMTGTGTVSDPTYGMFTLTQTGTGANDLQYLTFDLINGYVLAGVAVHAGYGQTDEFFRVDDQTSGTMFGPFYGPQGPGNGKAVSNFDILLEQEPGTRSVPDTGATATLLGIAFTGLVTARRRLTAAAH